jgi:predicted acylesterase/phospholipase RssA
MSNGDSKNAFEIGLVMAGAVSAGAYTAGVIDFLLQALDEWYKAKSEKPEEVPSHHVQLKVMAGSSAGGMTGAITAATLNSDHIPVTSLPGLIPDKEVINQNKLYDSWVRQIDIRHLLGRRDLMSPDSKVTSLLDSSILNDIADIAIDFNPIDKKRDYVAEQLHLLMTITNLKGVPYDITFEGLSGATHRIAQHTDFMEFIMSKNDPEDAGSIWLNTDKPGTDEWELVKQYALATGAFPGGLAPRLLSRKRIGYDLRKWPVPARPEGNESKCIEMMPILPSWPKSILDKEDYQFLAVDGGVMDNEPLELARQKLAGSDGFNARSPFESKRAVLMIDPFPAENTADHIEDETRDDLLSVFKSLFGSLLTQARFKPDELMLANSSTVYSRYLIAPTRRERNGEMAQYPIASGTLGGFGGFLSEKFRMHDFQLGRRNCQQFLRKYFVFPVESCHKNPVYRHYTDEELQRFSIDRDGNSFLPVIPLVGTAQQESFPLIWNTLRLNNQDMSDLRNRVEARTEIVSRKLLDQYIDGGFSRTMARLFVRFKRKSIVNSIMDTIEKELKEFKLRA